MNLKYCGYTKGELRDRVKNKKYGEELEEVLEDMIETTKKITASEKDSRKFLVKAEICDEDGS